jgi:hypothetical protein
VGQLVLGPRGLSQAQSLNALETEFGNGKRGVRRLNLRRQDYLKRLQLFRSINGASLEGIKVAKSLTHSFL